MAIIKRKKRETPFVQIDKRALQDKTLSWKAKGILAYLLSLPDDWQVYISELKNHSKDGRDSTTTGFNELVKAGYITKEQIRKAGQFKGYDYTVTDEPKTENPKTVKAKTENPQLLITNNNNKDFNNKDLTNKDVYKKDTRKFPSIKAKKSFNENDKRKNKSLPFDIISAKETLEALFPKVADLEEKYNSIFRNYEANEEIFKHCLVTFIETGISNYYTNLRDIVLLEKNLLEWIKKEVIFRKRGQNKKDYNSPDTNEDGTPSFMCGLKY